MSKIGKSIKVKSKYDKDKYKAESKMGYAKRSIKKEMLRKWGLK